MTLHIGFTGTQQGMSQYQVMALDKFLSNLSKLDVKIEAHHGDCVGADDDFDTLCRGYGWWRHHHIPTDDRKQAFSFNYDNHLSIMHEAKPYLERNKDIVAASRIVFATPKERLMQQRSGTWFTIRHARKMNRCLIIVYPDFGWINEGELLIQVLNEIRKES